MSYQEAFCNITSDLSSIASDIDRYDRKTTLFSNWATTSTTHLYQLAGTGNVAQLFVDSAEGILVTDTPNANNEYAYNTATDVLTYFLSSSNVSSLNSKVFEKGEDWATLKAKVCNEQASFIRSYLNDRAIYKRSNSNYQGAENRDYDFVIIRCNALLAVADLIRSSDLERASEIEELAMGESGLLTRIKRGDFALWHETTKATQGAPTISEISVHANTTGYIEDIKMDGLSSTSYDQVIVEIQQGGNFVLGTASPVFYNVYVKDNTGLKMHKVVDNEQVTGDYQNLAYNGHIRFQIGAYTTSDQYLITFQRDSLPVGSVTTGQIYR